MSHAKLLCLMVAGILVVLSSVSPAADTRSYVSGNTALTLDGKTCGFIKSVAGGAVTAEVIQEPSGPSYFTKKHIGQPKYEDVTMQMGFTMTKPVYDWIQQSWTMSRPRKSGSLIAASYDLKAESERQFFNAMITETTIPAMDGASKEPAYMTVTFSPEYTRVQKASGPIDALPFGKNEQKVFLPSNFKLEIDGLDCSKVSRVESFTVRQTVVTDNIGDARDFAKEPGKLEFPNLKITIVEATAQPFLDWHENFVIKGNNDEGAEKKGSLTLLSPDLKTPLAKIKFYNLGVFRIQPDKSESGADQVRRLTVEMYVERMEFECPPATGESGSTGTTPPATPVTPIAPRTLTPLRRG